jgi:hypothetical protein
MLSELTVRTTGPEVERAWKVIDYMISRRWSYDYQPDAQSNKLKSHLWKPLKKLMERAKKAHEAALREEVQGKSTAVEPLPELEPPTSIMNMNLSVDRLFPDLSKDSGALDFTNPPNAKTNLNPNSNSQTSPADTSPTQEYPLGANSLDATFTPSTTGIPASGVPSASPVAFPTMSTAWLSNADPTLSGTNAFDADTAGFQTTMESPLLPDGSVNWTSWDNLMAQYGMDVDENQANSGQPMPYNSTFSSLTQWY